MTALQQTGCGSGEVMLIHDEWSELLDLDAFVKLGKFLTRDPTG